MRPIAELRIKPLRRNPYQPATEANLADFERVFGVKLPIDYAVLLKTLNGGRPYLKQYDDPSGGTGSINIFYGLGDRTTDAALAAVDASDWDLGNLWGETRIR